MPLYVSNTVNRSFEVYNWSHKYALENIISRKSGKHLHATHGTAVSTEVGLSSSARRDLHHWRSNQQPQFAEAETLPLGNRFMAHIGDAK